MNATEDMNWLDSPSVLDSCIERIKQVKALGLDAGLDFHGRLHRPMAKQLAKALEPYRPLFIEEPLLVEHPEAIKQLSQHTTIPIAFGERLYTRWDVKRFLEDASVDVLQPDIAHAGGISETKRIATMAETYDVAIAPHCPLGEFPLFSALIPCLIHANQMLRSNCPCSFNASCSHNAELRHPRNVAWNAL